MLTTTCDVCQAVIERGDPDQTAIEYRHMRHHLCGACAAGFILMMKDMRLVPDEPTIR